MTECTFLLEFSNSLAHTIASPVVMVPFLSNQQLSPRALTTKKHSHNGLKLWPIKKLKCPEKELKHSHLSQCIRWICLFMSFALCVLIHLFISKWTGSNRPDKITTGTITHCPALMRCFERNTVGNHIHFRRGAFASSSDCLAGRIFLIVPLSLWMGGGGVTCTLSQTLLEMDCKKWHAQYFLIPSGEFFNITGTLLFCEMFLFFASRKHLCNNSPCLIVAEYQPNTVAHE